MKKVTNFLIGSIYAVLRFIVLGLLAGILIWLCLFSIDFDSKNYDLIFISRINRSIYYGIEYRNNLEVWKIERSDDDILYTRRLYP